MESDLWLAGIHDLLVKGGCFELGCPLLLHGEPRTDQRQGRVVISHAGGVSVEVNEEMVRGLARRNQLGITSNVIGKLKAAHERPGEAPHPA